MAKRKRRRGDGNRAGKTCISMILLAFVAVMSIQIIKIYKKDQAYAAIQQQREQELKEEEERKIELEEYEKDVNSQETIEDTARDKLGLLYEDEIIFRETKE